MKKICTGLILIALFISVDCWSPRYDYSLEDDFPIFEPKPVIFKATPRKRFCKFAKSVWYGFHLFHFSWFGYSRLCFWWQQAKTCSGDYQKVERKTLHLRVKQRNAYKTYNIFLLEWSLWVETEFLRKERKLKRNSCNLICF